jgi:predicted metal-binding membrane protein
MGGYLAAWTVFSLAATLLQWILHDGGLLNMQVAAESPIFGGLILVIAGAYQFTPWKNSCLHHCRTPMSFFLTEWRAGPGGAFRMGIKHGTYCAGCCWMLMALLFVGGVMNLLWVAGIAIYILIEKVAPAGKWVSRAVGAGMLVWGILMAVSFLPALAG